MKTLFWGSKNSEAYKKRNNGKHEKTSEVDDSVLREEIMIIQWEKCEFIRL